MYEPDTSAFVFGVNDDTLGIAFESASTIWTLDVANNEGEKSSVQLFAWAKLAVTANSTAVSFRLMCHRQQLAAT